MGCNCKKKSMPPVKTQVVNVSRAIGRVANNAIKKERIMVFPEEREKRISICNECDKRQGKKCSVCGCFVRIKAILASENCPLSKWPEKKL